MPRDVWTEGAFFQARDLLGGVCSGDLRGIKSGECEAGRELFVQNT